MNKYRNQKAEVNGITFASKKEANRYGELKLLERAGEISCLLTQPVFLIKVNEIRICKYIGDFQYIENGKIVVEDVKSEATRKLSTYRLKKKLMLAVWNLEIKEI